MMIEEVVLEYLTQHMDVPVLMEFPEVPSESFPSMPERFIVLERLSGSDVDHIGHSSIAVQSYSLKSLYDAASLDDDMQTQLFGILESDHISAMRHTSTYNHTDPRTKRYRYQSVFEFTHY